MDHAGDLAQLVHRTGQPGGDPVELRAELGRHRRMRRPRLQRQGDQPLLGTVVQVTLDPPARLVGGGDDPRTRGGQLGMRLRARDRGRDERHCCIELSLVILTGDLPARVTSRAQRGGLGAFRSPGEDLQTHLAGPLTEDLTVKITGDRLVQQCPPRKHDEPDPPRTRQRRHPADSVSTARNSLSRHAGRECHGRVPGPPHR